MLVGNPNNKVANSFTKFACQNGSGGSLTSTSVDGFNVNQPCSAGLKIELFFPPCWDGLNLYKADGSHMRYPIGANSEIYVGSCPLTHPVRLPAIMLEHTWHPEQYAPGVNYAGNLAWANGDMSGFGYHGDFVNGWDIDVLGAALNNTACMGNNDIPFQSCSTFAPSYNPQAAASCKPDRGVVNQPGRTDNQPISALPGCNPLWESGAKPGCPNGSPSYDISGLTGTDGPYVTDTPMNFALPTTPGWKSIACIQSDSSFVAVISYTDPAGTQDSCLASCSRGGYTYAGMSQRGANICACGNSLSAPNAAVVPGSCTTPCPGNSAQTCGGSYLWQMWYAPNGTTIPFETVRTASNATYLGCLNTASPKTTMYSFTSSSMDIHTCNSACAAKGATWAATTRGNICNCGVTLDSLLTNPIVPDRFCNKACYGNTTEFCGDTYASSVYNLTMASYAASTATFAPGPHRLLLRFLPADPAGGSTFYHHQYDAAVLCVWLCRNSGFGFARVAEWLPMSVCQGLFTSTGILPGKPMWHCFVVADASSTCGGSLKRRRLQHVPWQTPLSGFFAELCSAPTSDVFGDMTTNYTYFGHAPCHPQICVNACNGFGYGLPPV